MRTGRPPKDAEDRKTANMKLPLTDADKLLIEQAAATDNAKPVTWARDVLLKAAKRRVK